MCKSVGHTWLLQPWNQVGYCTLISCSTLIFTQNLLFCHDNCQIHSHLAFNAVIKRHREESNVEMNYLELVICKASDRLDLAISFKSLKYPVTPCEFMAIFWGILAYSLGTMKYIVIFSATLFLMATLGWTYHDLNTFLLLEIYVDS